MSKRPGPGVSPAPITLAKKRRSQQGPKEDKVTLERILGHTCLNSSGLAVCGKTGCIAYPAGCVAVLYLPKKSRQLHVLNHSRRPISCICLSSDGKYLVTGESGRHPCVRVWDISSSPMQVAQLKGHNFGISCVAFSPNLKYLVSVGYHHDMQIYVWNWKNGVSVASNKITSKVYGVAFSEDGSYFVTSGNRRVRFWYFDTSGRDGKLNHAHPLKGRSAILGELQDNCFVSVACGRGPLADHTYTLTKAGIVCLFDSKRILDRFTETKASPAHCLVVSEQYVFCGCSEGVVRIFDPCTLDYLITVPKPHPLGVDIAAALDSSQFSGDGKKYPDTTAMAVDGINKRLTVVYNDHSMYVWDLKNIKQIGKTHSFLYHSACVWDICMYPQLEDKARALLPENCFVTCSSDNTIRFWCVDWSPEGTGFIKNIYSKELMRVLYTDPDTNSLKDMSSSPGDASTVADATRGVRSIQFHPNGQHLAVGDRAGNLKVYDLHFMDQIIEVVAHDSEILCIEYSQQFQDFQFLATASRDRLIHVFTAEGNNYQHVQTLDDHSASITSVKFTGNVSLASFPGSPTHEPKIRRKEFRPVSDEKLGDGLARDNLQLLSCGADKSIMFRSMEKSPDVSFQRSNHIMGKASIYDMDIDISGKLMATAGQDKVLRIYHIATGKQKSMVKATSDDGSLLKVTLDPSGLYAATSSSDKTVSLFDFYSGECLARLYGHSEVVTQLHFSRDCKYLYSVSGDSCIFIWRLSRQLTQAMHDRLGEIGKPVPVSSELTPLKAPPDRSRRETYSIPLPVAKKIITDESDDEQDSSGFRLSVSQLPGWAQKQVIARPSIAKSISTSVLERATGYSKTPTPVEGRWAQRISEGQITFASEGQAQGQAQAHTESDSEMEDLTAEMTKVVSEEDIEVIDLTEDSPAARVIGNSYVTARKEEGRELSWEEEEEEEEVIYPTLSVPSDVDPCTFKVKTPEKPLRLETENLDGYESDTCSPAITPVSSPTVDRAEFGFGEENFLKTHFESLTAEKVDELFQSQLPEPLDVRLSISTQFLSRGFRSWKEQALSHSRPGAGGRTQEPSVRLETVEHPVVNSLSSAHSESTEERGSVGDAKLEESKSDSTVPSDPAKTRSYSLGSKKSSSGNQKVRSRSSSCSEAPEIVVTESQELVKDEIVVSAAQKSQPPQESKGEKMSSDSPSHDTGEGKADNDGMAVAGQEEELGETEEQPMDKKEEWEADLAESRGKGKRKRIKVPRRRRSIEEDISKAKKRLQELGYAVRSKKEDASHQVAKSSSEESAQSESVQSESVQSEPLLSRANRLIQDLDRTFSELTALHDEAMGTIAKEGTTQEESTRRDCEETVTAVATAVSLLKNKTVSMANENRRKWRGKDKSSGYSLRSTPSKGVPVMRTDLLDTESTSSCEDRSEVGLGLVLPISKLAEVTHKLDTDEQEGARTLSSISQSDMNATATSCLGAQSLSQETQTPSESDVTTNPAVVELLERYSEQLLSLMQQKIHPDVS